MNDENDFSEISRKLDVLIRLSAIGVIRGEKLQKDQIAILSDSGFKPKEIADILKTSSNNVSVTLVSIRKERTKADHNSEKKAIKQQTPMREELNSEQREVNS